MSATVHWVMVNVVHAVGRPNLVCENQCWVRGRTYWANTSLFTVSINSCSQLKFFKVLHIAPDVLSTPSFWTEASDGVTRSARAFQVLGRGLRVNKKQTYSLPTTCQTALCMINTWDCRISMHPCFALCPLPNSLTGSPSLPGETVSVSPA